MELNVPARVIEFLTQNPGQKFRPREIANWIFKTYPEESEEKRKNSKQDLDTDAKLIRQIAGEIYSCFNRGSIQKKEPKIKITTGSPRQYYYFEFLEETEVVQAKS